MSDCEDCCRGKKIEELVRRRSRKEKGNKGSALKGADENE